MLASSRFRVTVDTALIEIHGRDEVARLLADACEHHAFSCEYVLSILAGRKRLHLLVTRT